MYMYEEAILKFLRLRKIRMARETTYVYMWITRSTYTHHASRQIYTEKTA